MHPSSNFWDITVISIQIASISALRSAFFTTSLTWAFQVKLLLIVIPSNLALLTASISLPSMDTRSKASGFRANEMLNSLHLSGFRTTLFLRDHSINSSV